MRTGSLLAAVFLGLVAVGHMLRLILNVEIIAHGMVIPMWVSVPVVVVPLVLVFLLWRESRS